MKRQTEASRAESTRRLEPRSDAKRRPVACSSFTLPMNSQEAIANHQWASVTGTVGIDWFQISACVIWDYDTASGWFEQFADAKEEATDSRNPVLLPVGEDIVQVKSRGVGTGNDSHKEFQLTWQHAHVGLSQRPNPSRQIHNASLCVQGTGCLITGWGTCWEFFHRLINNVGGVVTDEWIRRIDICIDLPDVDFDKDIYPALKARQIVTSCRGRKYYEEGYYATGFAAGNSGRHRIQIYDKLLDSTVNHDPVYLAAMQQRRWNGTLPSAATRVEWQVGRPWLSQYGLDTTTTVLERLSDIFDILRSSFRITADPPDNRNNHQSRTAVHPLWQRICQIGEQAIGQINEPLKRLNRTQLDERRAVRQIVGFATSIADRRGMIVESKDKLLQVISEAFDTNGVTDDEIAEKSTVKAKASGTWQNKTASRGKEAA